MTVLYLTGPAGDGAETNRLAATARRVAQHPAFQPVLLAMPGPPSTPAERFQAICEAEVVVLTPDWATDPHARRDTQVAVWAGKPIKQYDPLSTAEGGGGSQLRVLTAEAVQTVLDRGLSLALPEHEEDTQS